MTIEKDIYDLLVASTSVTALSSNRVYPQWLPQNVTYPAITYNRISSVYTPLMGSDSTIVDARFQIDCWAESAKAARNLGFQMRAAMQRYKSSTGSVTSWDATFIENQQDFPQPDTDEDVYRVLYEFMIHYKE